MSHHYATKALGRAWLPSPTPTSPRVSSRGRFGPRPAPVAQESWFQDLRILRGRLIERLGVLLALAICAAYLICHRDQFAKPVAQAWTHSLNRLRHGGSLLPSWIRADWSSYAYVTYATSPDHVCNSLMLAESLHRLGARPDTLILYAANLTPDIETNMAASARLLLQARELYGALIQPVDVLSSSSTKLDTMWSQGFTKLLAFNQTQYKRILSLDSDATLLRTMDELFLIPEEAKIAMPSAYWLNNTLCAAVMLVSPSQVEFERVQARLQEGQPDEYDMEIVNALYKDDSLVIPHNPYLILTGEMRAPSHAAYLGSVEASWDVSKVMSEAKYIHFSDYPIPKPWIAASEDLRHNNMPKCKESGNEGGGLDCADRDAWLWLYTEFRERRKRVCGPGFAQYEELEKHLEGLPPMAKGLAEMSP